MGICGSKSRISWGKNDRKVYLSLKFFYIKASCLHKINSIGVEFRLSQALHKMIAINKGEK